MSLVARIARPGGGTPRAAPPGNRAIRDLAGPGSDTPLIGTDRPEPSHALAATAQYLVTGGGAVPGPHIQFTPTLTALISWSMRTDRCGKQPPTQPKKVSR